VFAAGYDLRGEYDAVMREFDAVIGLDRLGLLHLNDSKAPLGSRVDRHEQIGQGELGEAPFAAIMSDVRLERVPRVIETPKGTDPVATDRQNLDLLRRLATR
jgi:deoxyribonuclease-4